MKKELFDEICKFCEYLTNWETKKDFYAEELLPDWVYGKRYGLDKNALVIFDNIYQLTPGPELKNLTSYIIEIREDKESFLNKIKAKNLKKKTQEYNILFNQLEDKYGFQGFIHSTSFENFKSIMKNGYIYSRSYLKENNILINDIALDDVIDKTYKSVKNFVRLYWRVKNTTNYTNEGIKPKRALIGNYKAHSTNPVIFIIDKEISLSKNVFFTDGNAGSLIFKPYQEPLDNFKWNDIFHENDKTLFELSEERFQQVKNAMSAEILYPQKLKTNNIRKIIFRNKADYDRAILEFGNDEKFCIDDSQFCNNWLYIKDYNISYSASNIKLEIIYHFGKEYRKSCNLLDYTHTIKLLDSSQKTLKSYNVNSLIHNNFSSSQIFTEYNDKNAKYVCYYIDGIECIKAKIND